MHINIDIHIRIENTYTQIHIQIITITYAYDMNPMSVVACRDQPSIFTGAILR